MRLLRERWILFSLVCLFGLAPCLSQYYALPREETRTRKIPFELINNLVIVPLEVKQGDRVLFGKYSGTEVKLVGEEHLIVREDDILGVLE